MRSDNDAAGKLTSIPGIVEAAAMKPIKSMGVPRLVAKGFRTGFLDIVELSIAKAPIMHSIQKNFLLTSLNGNLITGPASHELDADVFLILRFRTGNIERFFPDLLHITINSRCA